MNSQYLQQFAFETKEELDNFSNSNPDLRISVDITQDKLVKFIIDNKGKKLYLSYANLTDANLTNANLTNANLTNANLSYANLTNANLSYANLTGADLTGANLTNADLRDVYLTGANFLN